MENHSAPMVVGTFFYGIASLLKKHKINVDCFYEKLGLTPDIEQNSEQLIPLELLNKCMIAVSQKTTTKHPALYIAKQQIDNSVFAYFNLILCAPNIEIAFQLSRRFRYIYSEVTHWDWQIEQEFVVIKTHSLVPMAAEGSEMTLLTMAKVFLLLKILLGDIHGFKRISLIQSKDKNINELESFFNCPVSYSQEFDGFILKKGDFYRPNPNFNAHRYHKLLEKLVYKNVIFPQNQLFSSFVKILILQVLSTGHCALTDIAKQIGMSPRAVQKRLFKEQLTFKEVMNDVRMCTAKRLLAQPNVPLTQIASMLGYSEASAFSRAFQAINKCSPRAWRKNTLKG